MPKLKTGRVRVNRVKCIPDKGFKTHIKIRVAINNRKKVYLKQKKIDFDKQLNGGIIPHKQNK